MKTAKNNLIKDLLNTLTATAAEPPIPRPSINNPVKQPLASESNKAPTQLSSRIIFAIKRQFLPDQLTKFKSPSMTYVKNIQFFTSLISGPAFFHRSETA